MGNAQAQAYLIEASGNGEISKVRQLLDQGMNAAVDEVFMSSYYITFSNKANMQYVLN